MVQYRQNIETESRIRWKVYVRFGGEHLEIAHVHMIRRRVLSLHFKFFRPFDDCLQPHDEPSEWI